jgi:hypothetical protein
MKGRNKIQTTRPLQHLTDPENREENIKKQKFRNRRNPRRYNSDGAKKAPKSIT